LDSVLIVDRIVSFLPSLFLSPPFATQSYPPARPPGAAGPSSRPVAAAAAEPRADAPAKRLWGGRFTGATDPLMERFNESLSLDVRMAREDLEGSRAYARALARPGCGVLTPEEAVLLQRGLDAVQAEWEGGPSGGAGVGVATGKLVPGSVVGAFVVRAGDEDVHTANERRLCELIGADVGGKLHTGRSRNDQVATDWRLWLARRLLRIRVHLRALILVACDRADAEADALMPGFTHLQSAMTVRWSHWLLGHAAAWQRDDERLGQIVERTLRCPLGSGALAGHPFGLDRRALAADLGFPGGPTPNSMDGVGDRDFAIESVQWSALCLTHLGRWAEDLIVYHSGPFGMVRCSDAYATGSSLMPQKKNPDALELIRGKAGTALGRAVGALAALQSTPTTYNKDLQEIWPLMVDAADDAADVVRVAAGVLSTLAIDREGMRAALSADMLATDLAEYLVRERGVPFRETHHVSGACVKLAEDRGVPLSSLTPEDLRTVDARFGDDVAAVFDYERSAESRDAEGGASRRSCAEQSAKLREYLRSSPLDPFGRDEGEALGGGADER